MIRLLTSLCLMTAVVVVMLLSTGPPCLAAPPCSDDTCAVASNDIAPESLAVQDRILGNVDQQVIESSAVPSTRVRQRAHLEPTVSLTGLYGNKIYVGIYYNWVSDTKLGRAPGDSLHLLSATLATQDYSPTLRIGFEKTVTRAF